jgi:hypothetical protein
VAVNLVVSLVVNLASLVSLVTPSVPHPPTRLGLGGCTMSLVGVMLVRSRQLAPSRGLSRGTNLLPYPASVEGKGMPRWRGGWGLILIRLGR